MNQTSFNRLLLFSIAVVTSAMSLCRGEMLTSATTQTASTPLPTASTPLPTAPTPLPTAPTPLEESKEEAHDIYLNFENADLASFVDYMAEIKKLNVIPDKGLEGAKVSLTIRQPLTIDEAWEVFLTVLETSGFSIVKVGEVHKIIPKDKKLTEPLPSYFNVPIEQLPDSDITIRYVVFLTNIQVGDIQQLLESMLSTPNSIIPQPDMNAFIITDKSNNIKSAIKLIQELDSMGLPEEVTVMKLKQVNAADAKELLEALIKKPDQNPLARLLGKQEKGSSEYFSPSTRIISEPRTNSLILLGNRESIQKIIDFIAEHIDTAVKEAESPLHIYELQHIDAGQVRDLLKEVTTTQLDSATGQAAAKYGSIRGGVKYFRQMNFQVDRDGNRLIVSSIDKQDWELLRKTIHDLDKPQPLCAVETLFVAVNSNDMKELGGMTRNKKHGQIGKNIDFQSAQLSTEDALELDDSNKPISLLGNLLSELALGIGRTALTFGKKTNIWSIFRMFKRHTNASIMTQPFITIANKKEATISVGETRTIVGEDAAGQQAFKQVKASTDLIVTPQINLDGVIRLNIKLNVNEFTDTEGNTESVRELITDVTVADGQVLVLGGFVQTKVTESKGKTPLLGDIPILGWFFKNKSKTIDKQFIFIFMAPTIIKPRQSPGMNLYTKMKLHQATNDIEDSIETRRTTDPIHNWFFNPDKESYSHKIIDFANARYQPINVDIKNDPYYRAHVDKEEEDSMFFSTISSLEPPSLIQSDTSEYGLSKEESVWQKPADTVKLPEAEHKDTHLDSAASEHVINQKTILSEPTVDEKFLTKSIEHEARLHQPDKIDQELVRQRKKLKDLLLAQPMPETQGSVPVVEEKKRDTFKQMITQMPKSLPKEDQIIDPQRRNRLKEFLSSNPAFAKRSDQSSTGRLVA